MKEKIVCSELRLTLQISRRTMFANLTRKRKTQIRKTLIVKEHTSIEVIVSNSKSYLVGYSECMLVLFRFKKGH